MDPAAWLVLGNLSVGYLTLGMIGAVLYCGGVGGATVSDIDFRIRPRSLLVEITAVVSSLK
ncbi:MAG: hypothetical protein M3Q89_09210, partial [Verrucomicrobiota bacterium]|nr:hypothetical protein [Verrucomicrobiota bacterium]